MECGSSISNDGYGQDRDRIMAILAQDANTDRKEVPSSEPWDYRHLGELTRDGCCGLWPKRLRMPVVGGANSPWAWRRTRAKRTAHGTMGTPSKGARA